MDYRSFGAAAYNKAAGKNKDEKKQTGEVIRGGENGQNVNPVSFKPMDFGSFNSSGAQNGFSKSEKANSQPVGNVAGGNPVNGGVFSGFNKKTVDEKPLSEKKVSAPSWAHISKKDSNPFPDGKNYVGGEPGAGREPGAGAGGKGAVYENASGEKKQSPSQRLENATEYLKSGGLLKVPVEEPKAGGKDSAYRKVAKFLVLIGEDEAAKVLPHLSEGQIEKIIPEIASIRSVSKEEASVILEEFNSIVKKVRNQGGVETAREMLIKAYGEKRAEEMLKKAMPMEGKVPFAYLNDLDNERIYLLLKDENVGIQALALSHLKPKKSAGVINLMDPEAKKEIVMRLAKMEPVSPEVLRRVDQAMHEKSLNQTVEESENIDGRNALAQILKKMDISSENDILSTLAEEDPDLGQDLRSRLFTLDDVINADDRFVQEKLREMEEVDIAYLIAGKTDDFKEKILSNISANRRAEVREQDKILSVKRKSDVDKITNEFLSKLRRAFESGDLIIHDRNDDEFV